MSLATQRKTRRKSAAVAALSAATGPLLFLPFAACAAAALSMAGCGGNHAAGTPPENAATVSRSAAIVFAFRWPLQTGSDAATRAVPESAQSVRVTITDATGFVQSRVVNRPTSLNETQSFSFEGFAPGPAGFVFTAFTGKDGAGLLVDTTPVQTATLLPAVHNTVVLSYRDLAFTGVVLSPAANASLNKNQTLTLTAAGYNNGNLVKSNPTGQWSAANPGVATVSATGLVTAVGYGATVITFTDTSSGLSATVQISVPKPSFSNVRLVAGGATSLLRGQTVQIATQGLDADGIVLQDNPPGSWQSDNAAIATVSATGLVTAVGAGAANITFTDTQYGKTAVLRVSSVIPFASVRVSPEAPQVVQTKTVLLTATGLDTDGTTLQTGAPGQWVSDTPTIATVDSSGLVTGVYPGTAVIRFTDTAYGKSASVTVTVKGGDSQVTIQ